MKAPRWSVLLVPLALAYVSLSPGDDGLPHWSTLSARLDSIQLALARELNRPLADQSTTRLRRSRPT